LVAVRVPPSLKMPPPPSPAPLLLADVDAPFSEKVLLVTLSVTP
jgi:hypothetical protein